MKENKTELAILYWLKHTTIADYIEKWIGNVLEKYDLLELYHLWISIIWNETFLNCLPFSWHSSHVILLRGYFVCFFLNCLMNEN